MPPKMDSIWETLRQQTMSSRKPLVRQAIELFRLSRATGMNVSEYIAFGLADKRMTQDDLDNFVSGKWHWTNQIAKLNDSAWIPLLRNKFLFHSHLSTPVQKWTEAPV